MDAAGFSNTVVEYNYLDKNGSRNARYYRLLQFDNDGEMKMYNTIIANCSSNESVFMTFPNPSADAFTVVVNDELLSGSNVLTISDASGKTFENYSPSDGHLICNVASGDSEDINRAVASAKKAFDSGIWSEMNPRDKKAIMLRWAQLLNENRRVSAT